LPAVSVQLGPYSRRLRRGTVGELDGRSRQGRFARDLEAQLARYAGGPNASIGDLPITIRLTISRICITSAQLNALDDKLAAGDAWTDLDSRTANGLANRLRLLLRELKPAASKGNGPDALQAYLASRTPANGAGT
jgi:hypothetical protein